MRQADFGSVDGAIANRFEEDEGLFVGRIEYDLALNVLLRTVSRRPISFVAGTYLDCLDVLHGCNTRRYCWNNMCNKKDGEDSVIERTQMLEVQGVFGNGDVQMTGPASTHASLLRLTRIIPRYIGSGESPLRHVNICLRHKRPYIYLLNLVPITIPLNTFGTVYHTSGFG